MKHLHLDLSMGAAGDMLTAALLELLPHREAFLAHLNQIGLPHVTVTARPAVRCGITGTQMHVTVDGVEEGEHHHHEPAHHHHHSHSGLQDVAHVVSHLAVSDTVKQQVLAVYERIARAESHAHGCPVEQVHFHEVGALDAIADVTAVCMLLEQLAPDKITATPVCVGGGQVHCAHGILPVPAPATAYLLQGVPTYAGTIQTELCTPTGAALVTYFVSDFGPQPLLQTAAVGYGMGHKELEAANCLRAFWGEGEDTAETIVELSCNVDDMTAEGIAFAARRLLDAGARDVYTLPIGMKKSRPGTMICVLCDGRSEQKMAQILFRHTSTIGVRRALYGRYTLARTEGTVETPYGPVGYKRSSGFGVTKEKYAYEDLARIAREQGIGLAQAAALADESRKQ